MKTRFDKASIAGLGDCSAKVRRPLGQTTASQRSVGSTITTGLSLSRQMCPLSYQFTVKLDRETYSNKTQKCGQLKAWQPAAVF